MDNYDVQRSAAYDDGQDIRDRSFEFACRVVGVCQELDERGGVGRLMVPQLLNCSVSFATMLEEAKAAESDKDFISKCCIGLKEVREAWTRLRVCVRRRLGPADEGKRLVQEANELISIVTTIIRNKRRNAAARKAPRRPKRAHSYEYHLPKS
jgi:four helix bundle protein